MQDGGQEARIYGKQLDSRVGREGADGQPSGRQYRNGRQAGRQVFGMAAKWAGGQGGCADMRAGGSRDGRQAGRQAFGMASK
jgi:hypothetical protein